ncbi:MAG: hypothetical protein C7B44_14500 [Sulfobacillus thermosulfidooxidans]|nr:MAG: hypothetical protein C7B44_14500 [Sulfobacillus thermosulfidooxidans]
MIEMQDLMMTERATPCLLALMDIVSDPWRSSREMLRCPDRLPVARRHHEGYTHHAIVVEIFGIQPDVRIRTLQGPLLKSGDTLVEALA